MDYMPYKFFSPLFLYLNVFPAAEPPGGDGRLTCRPGGGAGGLEGLGPPPGALGCWSGPIREQIVVTWCPAARPCAAREAVTAAGIFS